jgi:hypothetical protein
MDSNIKLSGFQDLLAAIFGSEVQLTDLLREQGFAQPQVELLQVQAHQLMVDELLGVIHTRLTSETGKDNYYKILSRRFGLDGEPPESLDVIAQKNGYTAVFIHQLYDEILQRCQSKTSQDELLKSLKYTGVAQLKARNISPSRENVTEKLKRLTNLHAAEDLTRMDYDAKRLALLNQIQPELDALEAEYSPLLEAAEKNIAVLENEIRTDVLLHGESVQAGSFRAVYTKGRVSWDSHGIENYAASHPEVLKFRKQGEPSVALRTVNDK